MKLSECPGALLSWWWWRWWIAFTVWLTDERRSALFTARTIVRDPLRLDSDSPSGFEPAQNLSQDFVEWRCALVITTTPRRHVGLHQGLTMWFGFTGRGKGGGELTACQTLRWIGHSYAYHIFTLFVALKCPMPKYLLS